MAKQHSALTGNELHNPKGIGSESTGSLLILSQSLSAISASGHIVPSAGNTYNLGSSTKEWKDLFIVHKMYLIKIYALYIF